MTTARPTLSCILVGEESLLVQCGEIIRAHGHRIEAVATRNREIAAWAETAGATVVAPGADLAERLPPTSVDWLFSIANRSLLPEAALRLAERGAINFHDGPLPAYAGLNAPVWALINRERRHGVTWHLIEEGIDSGDVLEQRLFEIAPDETALTLNMRCYAAAIETFEPLLDQLETGALSRTPQDFSRRSYIARDARPPAGARLDFRRDAAELVALVRALDHGAYWNPVACPKIAVGRRLVLVGAAEIAPESGGGVAEPGTVIAVDGEALTVATATSPVRLSRLRDVGGAPIAAVALATPGEGLPALEPSEAKVVTDVLGAAAPGERFWRRRLADPHPAVLPEATSEPGAEPLAAPAEREASRRAFAIPADLAPDRRLAAVGVLAARLAGKATIDLAYRGRAVAEADAAAPGYVRPWVPLRFGADAPADGGGGAPAFAAAAEAFAAERARAETAGAFAVDLPLRDPAIPPVEPPRLGLAVDWADGGGVPGVPVTVIMPETGEAGALVADPAAIAQPALARLAARLERLLQAVATAQADAVGIDRLPILPDAEREAVLAGFNDTGRDHDRASCVHVAFAAQAARTPEATALVFEDAELTYGELEARANRVAQALRAAGVGPETLVGLYMPRSLELVIGALAILKAGGAYVPLDPTYPSERIALFLADSAAPVVLTRSDVSATLPAHEARTLEIDRDPAIDAAPAEPVPDGAGPANLAYVIYTSGSTGRPKGVMVEHRNVAAFFAGMDARVPHDPPGTWLAVTSLSFDISVLELFWTLARGFRVVVIGDEDRALAASGRPAVSDRRMEFSLFYWGNDDGAGPRKYELLLEGAKFADANGFCAVWTPERHFHAFGGPFPNPAVTGAAVAAVTRNLAVRAGSCVAPLHHVARIAEEWAVIDNLTNGRAGLAIASGWQPDDFVLRPENAPPDNKAAMLTAIEQLRRLWRGEPVAFPTRSGEPFAVVTQPRPVSQELPLWVTTAGNPATWREAGALGANVLTHLLGQSIDEVAEKIAIYREALEAYGRDPAGYTVTLMLHTLVGEDRDHVREAARGPMKDYLRSAAALIRNYAWAFPAFKKPAGVTSPFEIDLAALDDEEMDAILDFAFRRYFDESGLFGTVEDCLGRVERLKGIGVDEIACLVDYGVPTEQALAGLRPLADVLRRANGGGAPAADDFSIAAQIRRHDVTHLQCTPSMARMLCASEEARAALGRVRHLLVGGEALPGALVAELRRCTRARIENMYGPTETTVWSLTGPVDPDQAVVDIGTPIANTRAYVLDSAGEPTPIGVVGELWIAGEAVTRGYWRRPDLTAERFAPDPFMAGGREADGAPARMYRTGDLVRRREDGRLAFLGRADHQVKVRGFRIELGEIEACLADAPGIREAVVTPREHAAGDTRLVAYVTAAGPVREESLRDHAAARLPAHMVPSRFVVLEALPLTPNRKIDRARLPWPVVAEPTPGEAVATPPESDLERRIAEIWSRILGVAEIDAQANFFALGGHSLLALQAHREIKATLGAERLGITDIFRFPTLAALAGHIAGASERERSPASEEPEGRREAISRRRAMRASLLETSS
ncbi:MupA/Atu3671 family FMN-dependent luciferase-like monooxygenase [Salinarimonas sp.]|uniref:MupA/Atu3671 family FMN-dependent luciferase-like monooxygenase n=1 Tax=Salinarimonas sp. TaxID=2766526 RepID=UPI0032D8B56E